MGTGSRRSPETAALIVGAGAGERFGQAKSFVLWRGEPLLYWAARPFALTGAVDRIVLVVRQGDEAKGAEVLQRLGKDGDVVVGGVTRSASVREGLRAVPDSVERVLVHDAARPNASPSLVARVMAGQEACVLPAVAVHDALHRVRQGEASVVDREGVLRVQTPQLLFRGLLEALHAGEPDAADDGALAIGAGVAVRYVEGEEGNIKVTTPDDLAKLDLLTGDLRVGHGFDIHRLAEGRRLVVCGVALPDARGAVGHSDADVGCHALMDAILGASSLPDIGYHFPPSDPRFSDADSVALLREVREMARQAGFRVLHVDVTIVLESPKIGPHREAMRVRLAEALEVAPAAVSVKATTAEGLGPIGVGDAVAAWAVATLRAAPQA